MNFMLNALFEISAVCVIPRALRNSRILAPIVCSICTRSFSIVYHVYILTATKISIFLLTVTFIAVIMQTETKVSDQLERR